ncbi:cell division cycle protein 27-like protein B-like isoform X1 [Senna tora]|uniref:Cell division cycle protein 27-like protein B-like isoform X1 n=1 Tax=Senna tora TaxID=362788 RepID=A0A834TK98_9FABA|nr:cell division cycle protein 27-like protein B-like isoform X1 [Senna tora]
MEGILTDCVHKSLRHFMYSNAIFLCERLCAEFPTEANLQLLAGCYLQNNQAYSAYHILKGTQMAQSRYLFAISCFQMDLLREAEVALCPANEPSAEVPNGAAGHYLLGLIYRYTDRRKSAINHFKQALSMDPLMWAAYDELCILGAAEEATAFFGEAAALCIQKQYLNDSTSTSLHVSAEDRSIVSARHCVSEDVSPRQLKHVQGNNNLKDIPGNHHGPSILGGAASQSINSGPSNLSFYNTPSPIATQMSGVAPPPLCRNMQPNGPNLSTLNADSSPKSTVNSTIQAPRRKFVDEGKLRKISGRLFSDSGPRRSTRLANDASANLNASTTVVSGNGNNNSSKYLGGSKLSSMAFRSMTVRKGQSWANENIDEGIRNDILDDSRLNTSTTSSAAIEAKSCEQEGATVPVGGLVLSASKVIAGASEILSLLRILGDGYRLACLYRCQDALETYMKLPHKHYNTGWVLSQVGKAHFELVDYLEADQAFSHARQITPYSLEGMDIYSTVLYHLKEDMKLSYLAQELVSTDRLAPQSCAMGNCYSLQKDHETALKNFQRAVQLNPRFAYAHTLCGHEYVALEDFENGIKCYQSALRVDARHYNAWYGLGMVYLRQEKFDFSEHHFRMAFRINPRSSVIMSYLGAALHALKVNRSEEALLIMERAILADKKNPVPMYHKANILMSLENFDDALEVLEELKEYAPRESSVYALMGRIYKRRNMHERAMLHYGMALDLKPSTTDAAAIKAAIEKLHVPDEIEDNL